MEEAKDIGHLKSIRINIEGIMEMEEPMTLNQIVMLVGPNGSGKSFVLKTVWMVNFLTLIKLAGDEFMTALSQSTGHVGNVPQFVVDNTFVDQHFIGTIDAEFEQGNLEVVLKEGVVEEVNLQVNDGVETAPVPIFMSKNLRTFDEMKGYLNFQNLASKTPNGDDEILKAYRLYDCMFMSMFQIAFGGKKLQLSDELTTQLDAFLEGREDRKLRFMELDLTSNEIIGYLENGDRVDLTTWSAGEQSIVNMFVANSGIMNQNVKRAS